MKTYFQTIKYLQETFLGIAILILMVLPPLMVFNPDIITSTVTSQLFDISHYFLFFVMVIRPLADIFTKTKWIRPLVILRKGTGVISASIIVSFILAKLIVDPVGYFGSIFTLPYWSMLNYAVFAHLADLSAVILLVTSNNLSKRLLGTWWKKVQQLSYVYFYGSVLYVLFSYRNTYLIYVLIVITGLTIIASIKNKKRLLLAQNQIQVPIQVLVQNKIKI